MKKFFVIAMAVVTMCACGNKSQESAEGNDVSELIEQVKAAGANLDAETKALIEKQSAGELTEEENLTLIQKLKNIGAAVVAGEKESGAAASEAAEEVKAAAKEQIEEVTAPVTEKVEETKQKVNDVKAAAQGLKDAVNALKK